MYFLGKHNFKENFENYPAHKHTHKKQQNCSILFTHSAYGAYFIWCKTHSWIGYNKANISQQLFNKITCTTHTTAQKIVNPDSLRWSLTGRAAVLWTLQSIGGNIIWGWWLRERTGMKCDTLPRTTCEPSEPVLCRISEHSNGDGGKVPRRAVKNKNWFAHNLFFPRSVLSMGCDFWLPTGGASIFISQQSYKWEMYQHTQVPVWADLDRSTWRHCSVVSASNNLLSNWCLCLWCLWSLFSHKKMGCVPPPPPPVCFLLEWQ